MHCMLVFPLVSALAHLPPGIGLSLGRCTPRSSYPPLTAVQHLECSVQKEENRGEEAKECLESSSVMNTHVVYTHHHSMKHAERALTMSHTDGWADGCLPFATGPGGKSPGDSSSAGSVN